MKGNKHFIVNSTEHDKEKYTSVLTITYTWNKLFPTIIVKGKGIKKIKTTLPHEFYIEYSQESWINSGIFKTWVTEVLGTL